MTAAHLMRCAHSQSGWCMECVSEMGNENQRLRGIVPEVLEKLNDELCAENERFRALLRPARSLLSHPSHWANENSELRRKLSDEIAVALAQTQASPAAGLRAPDEPLWWALSQGWSRASSATKAQFPGAILERQMGHPDEGFAPYDMTIVEENGKFIPIHGDARMEPCEAPTEAALKLQEFWLNLPDESRMTAEGRRRVYGSERQ